MGSGLDGLGLRGGRRSRREAGHLRVGVEQVGRQPLAAEHQESPVLPFGLQEDLDPRRGDEAGEDLDAEAGVLVGGDAPGPPVGDEAVGVERAEVDPGRHVAGLEREAHAGGRERSPPELVDEGVVAEDRQMAGAAAGGDAGSDDRVEAARPLAGQAVHVGRPCGVQLGSALVGADAAEAVDEDEDDLGRLLRHQPG